MHKNEDVNDYLIFRIKIGWLMENYLYLYYAMRYYDFKVNLKKNVIFMTIFYASECWVEN